jgi:hypothetical protein
VAEWQAIVAIGEELLVAGTAGLPGLDAEALRQQVASDYTTLGNAHSLILRRPQILGCGDVITDVEARLYGNLQKILGRADFDRIFQKLRAFGLGDLI